MSCLFFNGLNSSKFTDYLHKFYIIGERYKVQQAAHNSPKNASTYSAQRPKATGCVEIDFYSLTRGSDLGSLHVKCCFLAQQRRRKYAESLPHILQPHIVGLLHRGYSRCLCTGDCALNSDSIRATLVSGKVPGTGPAETIELSASRRRGFPGMLRHCHRACMQNSLVCRSLVLLG